MLITFSVGNYKVFKEIVTLDMRGASISKPTDAHIIDAGKLKLLKSVAIYGPNASGKSKLLEAMQFMQDFVINSSKNTQSNEDINVDSFRLSTETRDKPSHFQVEFLIGEISYRYGFEATSERVTKEWLFFKPNSLTEKPLFVRMEDEIEIVPSKFKEGKGIEARTRANALFLSSVAQWNGEISTKILEWFDKLVFFDRWDVEDDSATMELLNDDKYKILMEEVLSLADLAINGLEKPDYEEVIDRVTSKRILLPLTYEHLYTLHKVYDQNNNEADVAYFEMDAEESTGTRNFFNLIGQLIVVVENGKILLGDELNAHFHPRLMQAIVMLFNSKIVNNKGGQFIFTTHDTNLIDTNFLSRDQIYFLEKNRFGASRLYSLVDFKTRSEDNHEREYFQGRYGAIPFIENLENAFEKIENGKTKTKAA